jgi:hypothetical protein
MPSTFVIVSTVIAFIAIALGAAYTTGALDPAIEEGAKWFFKAKMEAEAKEMQAKGLKEGEDFLKSMFSFISALLMGGRGGVVGSNWANMWA